MNIVKELRKQKGIVQKQLALDIGVSQPTVSDWEANKKDPSDKQLKKLAEYFGVNELVILGKGVTDLTKENFIPLTTEARILSAGIDKMPAADRQKALSLIRIIFAQYDEYFEEGDEKNET